MGFSKAKISPRQLESKLSLWFCQKPKSNVKDQVNEGLWAPGPVLKCRLYIQVWPGPQIRRKLPLKIVCCSQFPRRRNMSHTSGPQAESTGVSQGAKESILGINTISLSPLSLTYAHTGPISFWNTLKEFGDIFIYL